MSRPGYAGRKALSMPNTASASRNSTAAEARVPTHSSNACHLETMRGRAADATDTRRSVPWRAEPRAWLKIFAPAPEAQDRQQERREKDLRGRRDDGRGQDREPLLSQRPEAVGRPAREDDSDQREPGDTQRRRKHEPVFEPQPRAARPVPTACTPTRMSSEPRISEWM